MQKKLIISIRTFLFISFCLWFGGFVFYSGFVISAAHSVLKDHTIVGLITQNVTTKLNYCGFAAVTFGCIDLLITSDISKLHKRIKAACLIFFFASLISLVFIHLKMDSYIDIKAQEVSDWQEFYKRHKIYLLISTVQFFVSLAYIPTLLKSWKKQDQS